MTGSHQCVCLHLFNHNGTGHDFDLFDFIQPKTAEPSITNPITFKLPPINVYGNKMAQKSRFWTTLGVVMTITYHLLTSKFNKFISVSKCTKFVNFVKFPQEVYEISDSQTFGTHGNNIMHIAPF